MAQIFIRWHGKAARARHSCFGDASFMAWTGRSHSEPVVAKSVE
jgi:hypothetical protein